MTIETKSVADGLIPSSVGEIAFEVCSSQVDGVYGVSEEQIIEATRILLQEAHYLAEPSGAAPLAALLAGSNLERLGSKVVLVISGGNISLDLLKRLSTR